MFDDIPQNQAPQPAPTPPVEPALPGTGSPPMSPFVRPVENPVENATAPAPQKPAATPAGAPPLPSTAIPNTYAENDVEMLEMFKRESLSPLQKITLIIVTVLVIAALIGGGVWLYIWLDPLNSSTEDETTNDNQNMIVNTNDTNSIVVPPAEADTDGDGIKDVTEKKYGTDPTKIDTDGDELSDYDEIEVYNTKPLIPDTDGDTYLDGNEVRNGYDPNGPGRLNE